MPLRWPALQRLYSLLHRAFPGPVGDTGWTYCPKRAERVIFLFMSGGPSHIELFDPKPVCGLGMARKCRHPFCVAAAHSNRPRKTGCLLWGPVRTLKVYGNLGMTMTTLLPHLGSVADDITLVRSVFAESFNHEPAATLLLTGSTIAGRPTSGSWVSYGLGSLNQNLPTFVVLLSGSGRQPLTTRYWHNAFLPGNHQGVPFRSKGDPVLYLANPPGLSSDRRQAEIHTINQLNRLHLADSYDPEIETRIRAYEMACRMQSSFRAWPISPPSRSRCWRVRRRSSSAKFLR